MLSRSQIIPGLLFTAKAYPPEPGGPFWTVSELKSFAPSAVIFVALSAPYRLCNPNLTRIDVISRGGYSTLAIVGNPNFDDWDSFGKNMSVLL